MRDAVRYPIRSYSLVTARPPTRPGLTAYPSLGTIMGPAGSFGSSPESFMCSTIERSLYPGPGDGEEGERRGGNTIRCPRAHHGAGGGVWRSDLQTGDWSTPHARLFPSKSMKRARQICSSDRLGCVRPTQLFGPCFRRSIANPVQLRPNGSLYVGFCTEHVH